MGTRASRSSLSALVRPLTLTCVKEFPGQVRPQGQVVHPPAGSVSSAEKPASCHSHSASSSSSSSSPPPPAYLRLLYDSSRSPSAVGVNWAVPLFMLALWLTNHWVLVANPTRYHFPAACAGMTMRRISVHPAKVHLHQDLNTSRDKHLNVKIQCIMYLIMII